MLGDFGWGIFFMGVPFSILIHWKDKLVRFLSIYGLLNFLLWVLTKPVLRFLIPILPLGIVLTALLIERFIFSSQNFKKVFSSFLTVPWILSNFFIYFLITSEIQPFAVTLGIESREHFLNRRLGFYPVYQYANQNLGPHDKILLLGEQRTYHLKIPFVGSNIFAPSILAQWCNSSKNSNEIGNFFQNERITHLIISRDEIKRLGGLKRFGFSADGENMLNQFLNKNGKALQDIRGVQLFQYEITPSNKNS